MAQTPFLSPSLFLVEAMGGLKLEPRRGGSPRPASPSRIPLPPPKTQAKLLTAQSSEAPVFHSLPTPAPRLRSCLKPVKRVKTVPVKTVRFVEHEGWNLHHLRPFDIEEPANTYIPLEAANICPPRVPWGEPGTYKMAEGMVGVELRWPDPDTPEEEREVKTPSKDYLGCRWCVKLASCGGVATSFQLNSPAVLCLYCKSRPSVREKRWSRALDYNGEDDDLDEEDQAKECHLRIQADLIAKYPGVRGRVSAVLAPLRAKVSRVREAMGREKRNTTVYYRSFPRKQIHHIRQKLAWRFT